MISAFPLAWPEGWKRTPTHQRKSATFSKGERVYSSQPGGGSTVRHRDLTVADGVERVLTELSRMGIDRQDVVISTNVRTRLDGLPRSGEPKPSDPGAAVYWETAKHERRVMAIDRYDDVADNLSAISLTLAAMRSIERHGGAPILERAFTGFDALPDPNNRSWRDVLGVKDSHDLGEVRTAYRRLAGENHPDRGGNEARMADINRAWEDAQQALAKASA